MRILCIAEYLSSFPFVQPWCGLNARCFAEEKNTLPAAIKAEDPRCSSLQAFNSGALSGALEEGHEPEMESREGPQLGNASHEL